VNGHLLPASERDEGPAPLLALEGVDKRFGAFEALRDVSLAFHRGEIHCLLGENGAGKSTLCNLVFGLQRPSEGRMTLDGAPFEPLGPHDALAKGVAMVHQHFSLVDELSVVDNLLLGSGLGRIDRRAEAERIKTFGSEFGLQLAPFATVSELSVGERQRVEIVKCLMRRPQVLILDEPTAVLLPDEIRSLLAVCRQVADSSCAVIMVTHKLAEIEGAADRATVLHRGRIAARSNRPAAEIDRLVHAMVQRPSATNAGIGVSALAPRKVVHRQRSATEALQLDAVSFSDRAGVRRLDRITLTVDRGEIIGMAGVEGNGQAELGMILAGLARPGDGRWFVEGKELTRSSPQEITRAGVGIVPEDRHAVGSVGAMSLADNLFLNRMSAFARLGLLDRRRQAALAEEYVRRFDVRAAGLDAPFASLSGGNQQKAVLARELTTPNLRFLLAAHPTRGLDVGAVEAVYGMVRNVADDGVGVLLISSELDELIAVADRIAVIYRGQIVGTYPATPDSRSAVGALMSGKDA
jgi:general nucleoside transport system ATP-binding protein